MSPLAASVLTFLAYAVLLAATIAGEKFGIMDNATGSLIIGAVLSHLGFQGVPGIVATVKNGTQPSGKS